MSTETFVDVVGTILVALLVVIVLSGLMAWIRRRHDPEPEPQRHPICTLAIDLSPGKTRLREPIRTQYHRGEILLREHRAAEATHRCAEALALGGTTGDQSFYRDAVCHAMDSLRWRAEAYLIARQTGIEASATTMAFFDIASQQRNGNPQPPEPRR